MLFSDFLITISLEPNVVDLRYFKLWILLDQIIWVWNIKGLQHRVLKILRFKYLILFQRLLCLQNFFIFCKILKIKKKNIFISANFFCYCFILYIVKMLTDSAKLKCEIVSLVSILDTSFISFHIRYISFIRVHIRLIIH